MVSVANMAAQTKRDQIVTFNKTLVKKYAIMKHLNVAEIKDLRI